MRKWILFTILGLLIPVATFSNDLNYFRKTFSTITSKSAAASYISAKVTEINAKNIITINAYKAICKTMMAQYVTNPFSKLSWFKEGKKMLEKSIKRNKNLESIHLRLIVQLNAPSFLGYNSEIESDKNYILSRIEKSKISITVKRAILKNLMTTSCKKDFESLAKKYKVK